MSVTGVTASTNGTSTNVGVGIDGISGTDFMQILMKQLQYQDPLKPMDNSEMINQIAKIRELEMNTKLTDKLSSLGDQERVGSAAAMIGKYVRGQVTGSDGTTYTEEGTVTGIRFTSSGEAQLELDSGELLPLKSLTQVAADKASMTAVTS